MDKINKLQLFQEKKIRSHWDEDKEEWYFSVVDVCRALSESSQPRKYWNDLKKKLQLMGSQLSEEIGQLFDINRSVVTKHLKNIFDATELIENSVCANFAHTADDGKTYQYKFYSLPAIIAVGYRTKSPRATEFCHWATRVLETFTKQGYVLDKERLINGKIFDENYICQFYPDKPKYPKQKYLLTETGLNLYRSMK